MSWPPVFNVIYVPGTTRILSDFVRSLAEHSAFRFRLVSNSLDADEESFLADEAARHPRFELTSLATSTTLAHGEALQRLFRSQSDEHFAFLDSDIFARGPILRDAQSLLAEHAALFSGVPVWLAPEERIMPRDFVYMSGRFDRTDDGLCLGVSFCAIYRRAALETVMERTGVTFHSRRWSELPSVQRAILSTMKLAKRRYDTVKLVNLMLTQAGFSLAMCPDESLVHVGALSSGSQRPRGLAGRVVGRLREIAEAQWPGPVPRKGALERRTTRIAFARRRLVEEYFEHLSRGGAPDAGPARQLPSSVRDRVIEMGRDFLALRRAQSRSGAPGGKFLR